MQGENGSVCSSGGPSGPRANLAISSVALPPTRLWVPWVLGLPESAHLSSGPSLGGRSQAGSLCLVVMHGARRVEEKNIALDTIRLHCLASIPLSKSLGT